MSAGEIHRTLGDYPRARTFLARAVAMILPGDELELKGQVGLPAARARSHLAWTLAELGEFPDARSVAADAMRLALEQKERGNQVYALHLLAEIAARGASDRGDAERHYLEALALATELGMRPLAAHGHAGLSRLRTPGRDASEPTEHRRVAMTMYRDMAMWYWLERLETEHAAGS